MATVGKISVNLIAKTAAFKKAMRTARRRVRGFGRSIASMAKVAAGVAATGVAFGWFVKRSMNAVDAVTKLADRIGETTRNITGLRHAADITGAGAESMGAALDVMAKRLGEAARGSGMAKKALDALGLKTKDLLALSPAEQFMTIAEAVARLDTKSERAAATANIFSRANQKLLNTLELGREGIKELIDENERLGGSFSDLEGKSVEQANDALTRLGVILRGIGNQLAIQLSPYVQAFAEDLERMGNVSTSVAGAIVRAFRAIAMAAAVAKDATGWLEGLFWSGGAVVRGLQAGFTKAATAGYYGEAAAQKAETAIGLARRSFARAAYGESQRGMSLFFERLEERAGAGREEAAVLQRIDAGIRRLSDGGNGRGAVLTF